MFYPQCYDELVVLYPQWMDVLVIFYPQWMGVLASNALPTQSSWSFPLPTPTEPAWCRNTPLWPNQISFPTKHINDMGPFPSKGTTLKTTLETQSHYLTHGNVQLGSPLPPN